jgi:hypothetical protein
MRDQFYFSSFFSILIFQRLDWSFFHFNKKKNEKKILRKERKTINFKLLFAKQVSKKIVFFSTLLKSIGF